MNIEQIVQDFELLADSYTARTAIKKGYFMRTHELRRAVRKRKSLLRAAALRLGYCIAARRYDGVTVVEAIPTDRKPISFEILDEHGRVVWEPQAV